MRRVSMIGLAALTMLGACSQTTYVKLGLTDPVETARQRKIDEGACTSEAYSAIPPVASTQVTVNTAPRPTGGGFAGGFADGFERASANRAADDPGEDGRERIVEGCLARLGWTEVRA